MSDTTYNGKPISILRIMDSNSEEEAEKILNSLTRKQLETALLNDINLAMKMGAKEGTLEAFHKLMEFISMALAICWQHGYDNCCEKTERMMRATLQKLLVEKYDKIPAELQEEIKRVLFQK